MYANPFRRGFVSFSGALPPIVFSDVWPREIYDQHYLP